MFAWFKIKSNIIILCVGLTLVAGLYMIGRDHGAKNAIIECNAMAIEENNQSARKIERIRKSVKKLKNSDLDDELRSLGIMRDISDR